MRRENASVEETFDRCAYKRSVIFRRHALCMLFHPRIGNRLFHTILQFNDAVYISITVTCCKRGDTRFTNKRSIDTIVL
jgi:hypothetical protein